MTTKTRIWYPGCTYHIIARGNHKSDIFKEKSDFKMYLVLMKECLKYYGEYNYEIICYCLMTNHVHLLIKTNKKEVAYFIGRLHSIYAKYFNQKYDYVGHLYQDRYFAEPIKDDKHILDASRYIHLNPVKAKIVNLPEQYEYSSYSMYIGLQEENLIQSDNILYYFNGKRELYKKFVQGTPGVEP